MAAEKKCPHCGNWTQWQNQPSDRCEHCNETLDERTVKLQQEWLDEKREFYEKNFYRIREDDGVFMVIVRKVAMVFHMIFAAITWLIMWVVMSVNG